MNATRAARRRTRRAGALLRRRRLAQLPRSPMAIVSAVDRRCVCVVRRGVRALDRAAQPVRPGHAQPDRRAACRRPGSTDGDAHLPARHRRPGPRRPLGASCTARASRCSSASPSVLLSMVRRRRRWACWRATSAARSTRFIMRVCRRELSFPAILIALLIDGVGRALLPATRTTTLALRRADRRHRALRLGAVRAHGARLDAGRAQQGIRAGGARDRRAAARASCCATCCPT